MTENIRSILKSFFLFLIKPTDNQEERKPVFTYVIVFVIIYFLALIIFLFISFILTKINMPIIHDNRTPVGLSISQQIIVGMFIAPILEEFAFRYPLKYSPYSLSIGLVAYGIMRSFSKSAIFNYSINIFLQSGIIILLAVFFYVLMRNKNVNGFLRKIWQRYLIIIIYVFAAYFASKHSTLPLEGFNWIVIPVVVFPQFMFALYMSYLRLKLKFIYAVFFHLGFNSFIIGLSLLSSI